MATFLLSQKARRGGHSRTGGSSGRRRIGDYSTRASAWSSNSRERNNDLIKWIAVFLCCMIVSVLYMARQLPNPERQQPGGGGGKRLILPVVGGGKRGSVSSLISSSRLGRRKQQQHRIAIILPFVGEGLENIPTYLHVFCLGAAGASEIADFLFFHNGVLDQWVSSFQADIPDNVLFISLESDEAFASRLLRVLQEDPTNIKENGKDPPLSKEKRNKDKEQEETGLSPDRMVLLMAKHLQIYPYSLVEFKPALGHIFSDYLTEYSHWGYSDVDTLFGDLGRWVTTEELTDYDLVTYGFGDQARLYVRGQFTFHKNTPKVNQLWRPCEYLTSIDKRFSAVLAGKKEYNFESAEGCYSAAILQRSDIKVKYTVKAWTDIYKDDTAATHGLFLARTLSAAHQSQILYKALDPDQEEPLVDLSWESFENQDSVYSKRSETLQHPIGSMEPIDLPQADQKADCMFWVRKKYQSQLCLPESANVTSLDNLYWVNGQLHKQRYENIRLGTPGVTTAPFFHFQEWKRFYRPTQLSAMRLSSAVSTFVLTKEGAIPIYRKTDEHAEPLSFSVSRHRAPNAVASSPVGLAIMKKWKVIRQDDRIQLPASRYCLVSGPRKFPSVPPAPQCYKYVSWLDAAGESSGVEILSGASAWKTVNVATDVTLVLTLQVTAAQIEDRQALADVLERLVENLERWQGQPCVVVLYLAGATKESLLFLRQRFGASGANNVYPDLATNILEKALIAVVYREEEDIVSRKALMNMGIDAVPTRWYISGIELERGFSVSVETAFFAHRAARSHADLQGNVFLIPQFALASLDDARNGNTGISLKELSVAKQENKIKFPSEFEEICQEHAPHRVGHLEELWWNQTTKLFLAQAKGETVEEVENDNNNERALRREAKSLEELEMVILELLTESHHETLFALDESPILLVDNLGPADGMRTSEVVREVEELGGRRCYNGLRLAQLVALSYQLNVLAGAFCASTETSRAFATTSGVAGGELGRHVLGDSRCDGCFLFAGKHENILEMMAKEEIQRPAKAAILWDELSKLRSV